MIETAAYDFYQVAPDGVSMCAITSNIEHWNKENFKQQVIDPLVTAVKYLSSRHVDFIMHCGMPVVTTRGKGFEEEIVKQITDATGLPATTSIRSAIRALAHLEDQERRGADALSAADSISRRWTFLAASGFHVVADHTEDVVFKQLQDVTPAQIRRRESRVAPSAPSADGIYIPCNQWSGADAAPLIEKELRGAGRDRRARRLLGGLPLARHQRPHRRPRTADGQPEQRRGLTRFGDVELARATNSVSPLPSGRGRLAKQGG